MYPAGSNQRHPNEVHFGNTEHTVVLEKAKIGRIILFVVSVRVLGVHRAATTNRE